MKLRLTSPTFDASAKTVTHASFSDITLSGIQLIVNVTDQIIIYNFADSTKGGTLSTDTLTLEYDTTSMSDTDELMVLVDDGSATTAVSGTVAVTNAGITTIAGAVSGTEMQVDVLTSALPTGASTSAKQDTIIGHVDGIETILGTMDTDTGAIATSTASIDTKTPALGQALAGASVPVVLTASQLTTLTPPSAITGFATSAKQDTLISHVDGIETLLSGTLTVTGGGGGVEYTEGDTDATIVGSAIMWEDTGDTLRAVSASKPLPISDAGGAITVDGTVAVTNAGITTIAGAVSGTEMQVDVLTSALPTGASTLAEQQSQTTHLATIAGDTTSVQTAIELIDDAVYTDGSGTVTKGIAILGQDGTNPQAIKTDASGELQVDVLSMPTTAVTGTFWQATQPVSLTSTTVTGTVAVTQSGTWDEVGINDSGNSITVDYATTGSGTATGALRVELPTNGTGVIATVGAVTAITNALPAGTNGIGKLTANSGVDIGDVDVTSISAGSNLIGDVSLQPRTGNGCTIFRSLDLDESEEEVKGSAGNVYGYFFHNKAATTMWLKFYNDTAANVTVGSTTPVATFGIPAGSSGNVGFPYPVGFSSGITVAVTGAVADADTTAPAANDVVLNVFYK